MTREKQIQELYRAMIRITDQDKASRAFCKLVDLLRDKCEMSLDEVEDQARCNLGYLAGYEDFETRERVERQYGAIHPVFGSTKWGQFTPEEAWTLGVYIGAKMKEGIPHNEVMNGLPTNRRQYAQALVTARFVEKLEQERERENG